MSDASNCQSPTDSAALCALWFIRRGRIMRAMTTLVLVLTYSVEVRGNRAKTVGERATDACQTLASMKRQFPRCGRADLRSACRRS